MIRALALALLASPAAAQEFVPFDTAPTDDQFYRAIACAAPPDGDCAKPFLHWPAPDRAAITVGLVSITPTLTGPSQRLFEAGLADAIAQLNATGTGLTLQRDDVSPNIEIHIVPTPPNHPIFGTGIDGLDGEMLQLGRVALLSRGGEIQRGLIAVSAFARDHEIAPVLLEEVTQSLGLMTDLRGPGTETSVFGEDTNSVTHLSPRDIAAIQRHYRTP